MQYHLLGSSLCLSVEQFNAGDISLSFHFLRNSVYSGLGLGQENTEAAIISLQTHRKWQKLAVAEERSRLSQSAANINATFVLSGSQYQAVW